MGIFEEKKFGRYLYDKYKILAYKQAIPNYFKQYILIDKHIHTKSYNKRNGHPNIQVVEYIIKRHV